MAVTLSIDTVENTAYRKDRSKKCRAVLVLVPFRLPFWRRRNLEYEPPTSMARCCYAASSAPPFVKAESYGLPSEPLVLINAN